jgi:hypothetical protein
MSERPTRDPYGDAALVAKLTAHYKSFGETTYRFEKFEGQLTSVTTRTLEDKGALVFQDTPQDSMTFKDSRRRAGTQITGGLGLWAIACETIGADRVRVTLTSRQDDSISQRFDVVEISPDEFVADADRRWEISRRFAEITAARGPNVLVTRTEDSPKDSRLGFVQETKTAPNYRKRQIVVVSVVIIAIGSFIGIKAGGSSGKGSNPEAAYISDHQTDFQSVELGIAGIKLDIAEMTTGSASFDMNLLALNAQQFHDTLAGLYNDFAGTSNEEAQVFTASGELRDAMFSLVNYTGSPNPANLAHFTLAYQKAVSDWNQGVTEMWRSANKENPPTISYDG